MSNEISHLVWLGAGQAQEPPGLIDISKQITLVEVREQACSQLKQKYLQKNVIVKQALLTTDGNSENFTEYNLPEYSAIQNIAGLKKLFPGLRAVGSERLTSISVVDFIKGLQLTGDSNMLVIDIPDINLKLLDVLLRSDVLGWFNRIYLQTGLEPLYVQAATIQQVIDFLQENGYLLQQTINQDPDFPWLSFCLNPLWVKLQEIQQAKEQLDKENEKLRQQLAVQKVFKDAGDTTNNNIEKLTQDIALLQQAKEQASKQSATRKETVGKLEKEKRELEESNKNLTIKQNLLEKELIKAEAQIDLIKVLLIKE